MKMTAAVLYEQGLSKPYATSKAYVIEEVELEGPGPGEVLVEVQAAGLCHSDLTTMEGQRQRPVPFVGGHEGAGIVHEVGAGVTGLVPGDHVVMSIGGGCGRCRYCLSGKPNLCDAANVNRAEGRLPNGAIRISRNGRPIKHYFGISSFAEYAVTTPDCLVKIGSDVPWDVAAVFGCAVVTGVGAVFNTAAVRPGQHVAVFGLGGVGLSAVMGAKASGASRIIGIDLNKEKFPLARELGCTDVFSADDPDICNCVRDLTSGGVDYAIEVSGAVPALATANDITAKAGEVIVVGLPGKGQTYPLDPTAMIFTEKTFRGSMMGGGIAHRDIPRYENLYLEGKLALDRLKSAEIGFESLNAGFDRLDRGEVIRQILRPHG